MKTGIFYKRAGLTLALLFLFGCGQGAGSDPSSFAGKPNVPRLTLVGDTVIGGSVPTNKDPGPFRVVTTEGVIEGEDAGDGVFVFRGISYALPPLDDLRWHAPQPPVASSGIRETKTFSANCWQPDSGLLSNEDLTINLSEDCLYLNVWSPDLNPAAKLPVMFWIHGGGNNTGAASQSSYDGLSFARDGNVVLVTINYRLGPLGYLAHPDLSLETVSGTSGNYGQLDIIQALEWVSSNISSFGGDPGNVTIFGESAGGINTCNMIVSPLAAGLFHRAIMQSGNCSQTRQVLDSASPNNDESAEELGIRAAQSLSCDMVLDVIQCLRDTDPATIYVALDPGTGPLDLNDKYGPITDGYVFIDTPIDVVESGNHNRVPVIIGSTENEAGLFLAQLNAIVTSLSKYLLFLEAVYEDDPDFVINGPAADVLAIYPASNLAEARLAFQRYFTDISFTCPARRTARAFAQFADPVWRYEFTRFPTVFGAFGAFHGIEIVYVFGNLNSATYQSTDDTLSANVQSYWVNFANDGDPNSGVLTNWPLYLTATDQNMVLDEPLSTDANLREEACDVLESFQ